MIGPWIIKGQERAHQKQAEHNYSVASSEWQQKRLTCRDIWRWLIMMIMVSPGVRQEGRVLLNPWNLKRSKMDAYEADISFLKGD